MNIRQSTARTVTVGPILDADGIAKTDEVVGSIKLTKNGVVGAANAAATLTHSHAGKYLLALTAADTDTLGCLEISLNSGVNDMPVKSLNVLTAAAWDALHAVSGGLLPATGATAQEVWEYATRTLTGFGFSATLMGIDGIITNFDDLFTALSSAHGSGSWEITSADGFSDTDRTKLEAIHTKLPSASYLVGTSNSNGLGYSTLAAGAQMDLINAPNSTAISAIQSGLATVANQVTLLSRIVGTLAAGTHRPQSGDVFAGVDGDGAISANIAKIAGDAGAATKLSRSAKGIITGTIDAGSFTPTNVQFETSDITEATANHYKGRIVVFITGALAGQASDITAYSKVAGNGRFTVTALTEAPENGDTLVIV